jgi:hypothetical protein
MWRGKAHADTTRQAKRLQPCSTDVLDSIAIDWQQGMQGMPPMAAPRQLKGRLRCLEYLSQDFFDSADFQAPTFTPCEGRNLSLPLPAHFRRALDLGGLGEGAENGTGSGS